MNVFVKSNLFDFAAARKRLLKMKIIYNNIIPFSGFKAMMLFGVIFARKSAMPLDAITVNHEAIHRAQAKDCGGWVPYYFMYIYMWLRHGYRNSPFEREAYDNDNNMDYLENRKKYAYENC